MEIECDEVTLNCWHPLSAVEDLDRVGSLQTKLLGQAIRIKKLDEGDYAVNWLNPERGPIALPCCIRYGFLWTSLGDCPRHLFQMPEFEDKIGRTSMQEALLFVRQLHERLRTF